MTPREKAIDLIQMVINNDNIDWGRLDHKYQCDNNAKQCALITVNEILEMDLPILEEEADKFYEYWQHVKQEIENL